MELKDMRSRMNKQFQEISDEINKFETITRSESSANDRCAAQIKVNKKILTDLIKLHKRLSEMENRFSAFILSRNA